MGFAKNEVLPLLNLSFLLLSMVDLARLFSGSNGEQADSAILH